MKRHPIALVLSEGGLHDYVRRRFALLEIERGLLDFLKGDPTIDCDEHCEDLLGS